MSNDGDGDSEASKAAAGVWSNLRINPTAVTDGSTDSSSVRLSKPVGGFSYTGTGPRSRDKGAVDPFSTGSSAVASPRPSDQQGEWNPFGDDQGPVTTPSRKKDGSTDEGTSFVDQLTTRIRASFSSKRPSKEALKPSVPTANSTSPGDAQKKADADAVAKARYDALVASSMFAKYMKKEESELNKKQQGEEQSEDGGGVTVDAEFMSELSKRRQERDAQEAAHAEELRQAFLRQKTLDDAVLAKEQAEYNAKKAAEEEELRLAKVRLCLSFAALVECLTQCCRFARSELRARRHSGSAASRSRSRGQTRRRQRERPKQE